MGTQTVIVMNSCGPSSSAQIVTWRLLWLDCPDLTKLQVGNLHETVPRLRRRYVPEELSRCSKVYRLLIMDHKWPRNPAPGLASAAGLQI